MLYKLDKFGNGDEICLEDLPSNTAPCFVGFSHDMFVEMCVMAGCDFVNSLPGIGARKAHQHLRKLKSFVKAGGGTKGWGWGGRSCTAAWWVNTARSAPKQHVRAHPCPVGLNT